MGTISTTLLVFAASSIASTDKPSWEVYYPQNNVFFQGNSVNEQSLVHHSSNSTEKIYQPNKSYFPSLKERVLKELDRYEALPEDWDGEGAKSLAKTIYEQAVSFVSRYPSNLPTPSPMLSADGELSFYWASSKAYLELQLEGDGLASLYFHDRETRTDHFLYDISLATVDNAWFEKTFSIFVEPIKQAA